MPLGDSITDGYEVPGGYRDSLWRSLESDGYPVDFIDMHSALSTSDLADGVHPNAQGYTKMAARWYAALTDAPAALSPDGSSGVGGTRRTDDHSETC
jgi:lysophospholipase L1-like esterase